jgi:2-haloacid dehalogenase
VVPVGVRALAFDVFGTVVDWRGSIVAEGQALGVLRGVAADWEAVADGWRARYQPALDAVNQGRRPWATLDELHRATLAETLAEHGLEALGAEDRERLVAAWHRLRAWPDARAGLELLRRRFVLATLSNGHVALLVDLARHNQLPFDVILSAELAGRYKPDPAVYRRATELLGLAPAAVMMVAAHPPDLRAARAVGLRTALVHRPLEHGPARRPAAPPAAGGDVELVADDLVDLARLLEQAPPGP